MYYNYHRPHRSAKSVSALLAVVPSHVAMPPLTRVKSETPGVLIAANAVAIFVDLSLFETETIVRVSGAFKVQEPIDNYGNHTSNKQTNTTN